VGNIMNPLLQETVEAPTGHSEVGRGGGNRL
jgi:hypothetical protein